jgi:3-mercaptopyruvate sulfurtransferase SseA
MIFPSCSSSNSQSTSELTQPNSVGTLEVMPPYMNAANWDSVPRYTVQELKQKMDDKQKMLLVDVRYPDDYAKQHIQGAINAFYADVVDGKWTPTGTIKDQVIMY